MSAVWRYSTSFAISATVTMRYGGDFRRTPIEQRKRQLAKLVRRPQAGIVVNEVFEGDGDILFAHACKLGCEGIVSKRLGSPYRSGRSPH
jgi:bifunctional non-homologous end joining protein LigD